MDLQLHGKTAFVSGSTEGIGYAVAAALTADQGLPVDAMKAAVIGQNRTTLLERFIESAEIARLVTVLASPLASATNGAAVRADGGVLTTVL